jgi:hypothetical protein
MNYDDYDPPYYGGTPAQEGMLEQQYIFGVENPDRQWILTDWDVWVKNPYYYGPAQQHPEADTPYDVWEEEQRWHAECNEKLPAPPAEICLPDDDIPF